VAATAHAAIVEAPPRPVPAPRVPPAAAAGRAAEGAAGELVAADWLLVGEAFAPGAAAGDPERLLGNILRALGVSRDAAAAEGRACHVAVADGIAFDLDAALARVRPRCVLVLGKPAAQAALGVDGPLGSLRGRVHDRGGVPVVVTLALSYLLRHPAEKPKAWADLCLAVAEFERRPAREAS